jgi:tRNA dimethylallyltransferase
MLNGEIVSADSRYLYRGMSIGTAKPTSNQLSTVKHYLVDVAEIAQPWSLAMFQREAGKVLGEILGRGHLPLIVGGTGQYIFSLIEGWKIPPLNPDENLRKILLKIAEEEGHEWLHQKLTILDAKAADMIDYRNVRRTVRALEVIMSTGRRFSTQRRKESVPYRYEMIGLMRSRQSLYRRIDERIDQMIAEGFVGEVENLMKSGYGLQHPPMSAIGYKEIAHHLSGEIDLRESVQLIRRRTRQFVRRQANWFKPDDPRIIWFNLDVIDHREIEDFIKSRL